LKKKNYLEFLFLITLGALTSLSLPPYNFLFINFATFSLFFIYIFKKKKLANNNKAFLYGWFFGFGYFLTNLYWITISLTFDSNFEFLIPIALILIPAFLATFYGVATYCFFLINIKKPVSNLFLFSLLFGVIEFLRGNILTGFPWNLIAYSFSGYLEIIQVVSLIGTYAFNILCITFFISPSIFILRENKKEIIVCIFLLLSPIILYMTGSSKIKTFQSLNLIKNDYIIRAIGSKIELDRFYGNKDTELVIEELIELSEPDLDTQTLFVWPEGIIPKINQSELKEFETLFSKKFNKNHILGIGINIYENYNNENKFYNSFSFYNHKIKLINAYKKVNLVPFGEFLPFEKMLGSLGLRSLTNNYQSFSSGKNRKIIRVNENNFDIKILPLICYEIIYSGQIFDNSDFDYIINISEDGWFGESIGPHQHFTHSIFRAIESGKYLIRSANNGIAAVINPTGFIENKIPLGNSGYIDFSDKRVSNATLFSHHGNKMFLIIILLYIFLIFSFNRICK
jgi:apolipoprotein N-acyltransferase